MHIAVSAVLLSSQLNTATVPIHDSVQIGVPCGHWDVGDVRAPDLVHLTDLSVTQEIRVDFMPFAGRTELRFRSNSFNAPRFHQTT
jgi:hypothetical protein